MKRVSFLIAGVFLVSSFAFAGILPMKFLGYLKSENYKAMATDIAVSADGTPSSFIVLCGKNDLSPVFYNELSLFVVAPDGRYASYERIVDGGYDPSLTKYASASGEVYMARSFSPGSGGYLFFTLFKFENGKLERLVDDRTVLKDFRVSGTFENGFKAKLLLNGKEFYTLDLSGRKDFYVKNHIYDRKGDFLLKNDSLMANGVSDFEVLKDGVCVLSTSVSGAFHYDEIADLYVYFRLDGTSPELIAVDVAKSVFFN